MGTNILTTILEYLARGYIKRYKPKIIAVTGNVGKTSTKAAIEAALVGQYHVRASAGNLNNELGVPMTILGDYADRYYGQGSSWLLWLEIITRGVVGLIVKHPYPDILILEYGADRPGDIERLATTYPPSIAVITAIGHMPVHVEFFASAQDLAREKFSIVKSMSRQGKVIVNYDDPVVIEMSRDVPVPVISYGFNPESTMQVTQYAIRLDDQELPYGISFKLQHDGKVVPVKLEGILGEAHAGAAAAAAAVGVSLGMNLVTISDALHRYDPPAGRMRIISGIKNTTIIDDTYNASPAAMGLALHTIAHIPAHRKIAILGDMLELGALTEQAHREVGGLAGQKVSILIGVGHKSKFTLEAAAEYLKPEQIAWYDNSEEAKIHIQNVLQPGDLILVKGSQGIRMEKIVKEIMANPEYASHLLCRQSKKWLSK